MVTNLFEVSIGKNESNSFFRGEKNYFVKTPDFEQHNHGANLGGHVESFLRMSNTNAKIFDRVFIDFIGSLEITKNDLTHFMANLSAFFALKSRGRLVGSMLFKSSKSIESRLVKSYLIEISKSDFYQSEKDRLYLHANFISRNGNDILLKTLREIDGCDIGK